MPKLPFFRKPYGKFETLFRSKLSELDTDLPPPVWTLISWLESKGQCFPYASSQELFLSTVLVKNVEALWSHIHFVLPHDETQYWFEDQGCEKQLVSFIRCGGDGSRIALWKRPDSLNSFVFLGSEGDAFMIADDPKQLISLITMGYLSIEGRKELEASPEQIWREYEDGSWPEPVEMMTWATKKLGILYPSNGEQILPYVPANDPFAKFVNEQNIP